MRKREACFGELRCSRSDAGKREEGKRREMEMKEGAQNSRRRGEGGRRKKRSKWWSLSLIRMLEEEGRKEWR
jgi:hypothetical protein